MSAGDTKEQIERLTGSQAKDALRHLLIQADHLGASGYLSNESRLRTAIGGAVAWAGVQKTEGE